MTSSEPDPDPDPDASMPEDESLVKLVRTCLALIDGSGSSFQEGSGGGGERSVDDSPAHHSEPGPGVMPADRFELIGEVGRGSFGIVYRARDRLLGRDVALKVPRPELIASEEARRRFRREARALAGLDHPNLVPILEAGDSGPTCYIISTFCEGPNLASWLRARAEPVPWREAARTLAKAALAVAHAHDRGVLHRDIKPSNILLQPGGACRLAPTPRLVDFGLACLVEEIDDATLSGFPVGSPPYMSPEQATGRHREVGPAADVYSLGATLYEMLAGRPPFRGPSLVETLRQVVDDEPKPLRSLRPGLPRDLETICLRCLEKDPARRYASAQALASDLERLLDGQPISARVVGPFEHLGRWMRRPARIRDAGLTLLALGSTLIALGFSHVVGAVFGVVKAPRPLAMILEATAAVTLFDLPMAVAGILLLRGYRFGPWFGLISSTIFLATVTYSLAVSPVFTFGGILEEKSPRSMFEFLMLTIAAYAAAMSAIAVVADRAEAAKHGEAAMPGSTS